MNVTQLLLEVRDLLADDRDALPDARIIRLADRLMLTLVRLQVERDQSFYNCEYRVHQNDWKQVTQFGFDVEMPPWSMQIVDVLVGRTSDDTVALVPWSTPTPENRDWRMPRSVKGDGHTGWEFIGNNIMRIRWAAKAETLVVRCAKRPAPLLRGTIDEASADERTIYLPESFTLGTEDIIPGAYIGSRLQVTSGAGVSLGQIRSVVDSDPDAGERDTTQTHLHELTFATEWPEELPVGTVVESLLELADEHARVLILQIAEAHFQRTNNTDGLRSIGDSLKREFEVFMRTITPRDRQEPHIMRRSMNRNTASDDPDRASARYPHRSWVR